ncbi:hypothetical protein V5O48_013468, partial [Marasmius crinis-equi]
MKKRKSVFRATPVRISDKLHSKRLRTSTSDHLFVDRLELPSTSNTSHSFSRDAQNPLPSDEFSLRIPGGFPMDEDKAQDGPEDTADDGPVELRSTSESVIGEKQEPSKTRKRRTVRSRYPNIEWKAKHRATFLDQLMRGKGRGDARKQAHCSDCKGQPLEDEEEGVERDRTAVYRCHDCFLQDLTCGKCCVRRHWNTPFHRIEKWTGTRFQRCTLLDLGMVVQLQHTSGFCTHPKACYRHLLVIHTNGLHRVKLQFCGCSRAREQHIQLLQRRLYPTNIRKGRISTVITFECLEILQLQTLTTKGSIYDFYRALERLTDNTGVSRPQSRYRQLLRGIRQWRHLKYLMRAGKGQQAECSGIEDDPETSLTLKCPSCPHPGINLPPGWDQVQGRDSYLYRLCLCLDANFRLKEQLVSSHSRDPALCDGQGYFVGRKRYEEWIEENRKREDAEDEISNCVPFAALTKQATKFSKGLRYTGVVGVVCSRSDMIVKVGNLNKGERFSVVDYVLGMAMQLWPAVVTLLLCYDIACQYFRRFERRKALWPVHILLSAALSIIVAIGKLHHPGHEQEGHEQYSLNLIEGVGHTDGESCERFWGSHNALSNATKTAGPGARQDHIESQFEFWNWEKYKGMGGSLRKRCRDALETEQKQVNEHNDFSENIPNELVAKWEQEVVAWDNAPWPKERVLNPYKLEDEFLGEAEALKEIALEEEMRIKKGAVRFHNMSPGNFVKAALDLRDKQERLRALIAERKRDPTARQETKTSDERSAIRRQVKNLEAVRAIYMPGLLQHLEDVDDGEDADVSQAEDIRIWVPSLLPKDVLDRVCVPGLSEIEARLQKGRAWDALDGVRHTLRVKSRMLLFKNSNVRGQRDSGRSNATIQQVTSKAKGYAEKYNACREAYYSLSPNEDMLSMEAELPELKDGDVRSYKDPAEIKVGPGRRGNDEWGDGGAEFQSDGEPLIPLSTIATGPRTLRAVDGLDLIPLDTHESNFRTTHGTGDTRKGLSWIWTHRGLKINVEDGADDNNDLLRAEWCRSRARARRAQEEVMLVREEMRRTLQYLQWAADTWEKSGGIHSGEEKGIQEGRVAYSYEQAGMQRALHEKFQTMWAGDLTRAGDEEDDEEDERGSREDIDEEEDEYIDDDDGRRATKAASGGADIVIVPALNDPNAGESLVQEQNGAKEGDTSSERTAQDGEVTTTVTAATRQTQEADEAREGAAGHPDVVSLAKPASDTLEETGDTAQIESSDQDGDVAMAEGSPLKQIGSVEAGSTAGIGTAAEVTEERLNVSSAKLVPDQSEETPSATPGDDGDVNMVKVDPAEQTALAGGGDAEEVGAPTEEGKERSDPVQPTIDASDASEQTSSSHEVKGQVDAVTSEANVHCEERVEDQGLGGHDGEKIQDDAGVPEPEDTAWIEDKIICIQGNGSDSELSDISESNDEVKGDNDTDDDTDLDNEVAVAAGLKRNTRSQRSQPQAKASRHTRTAKKKKKGSAKRGGHKRDAKKKVTTKKSPTKVPEEAVAPPEIPRLVLGKIPKRYRGCRPVQLVDYKGGEPLTFTPECHSSGDLRDLLNLLKAANTTNTKILKTNAFSRTILKPETSTTPSHPKSHPMLQVVTHEKALQLPRRSMQLLFQQKHILIKGCFISQHETEWNEDNISTIGDMDQLREMHALWLREKKGSTANDRIRLGTFRDILQQGELAAGRPINCLDIPGLPSYDGYKPTQLQSCARAYQNTRKPGEDLQYPLDTSVWHLLATKSSSHHAHIDTSGYATMIAPQIGVKLVFLLVPVIEATGFDRTNGSLQFGETAHNMENEVEMEVVPVILRPGDVLLMRPCTYHYVVTLESSLCHGSHFMCTTTIIDTCYGILHDFIHHDTITNQDDVVHRHSLARMLIFWKNRLVNSHSQFFSTATSIAVDDLPNLKTFEGFLGFLTVYNIVLLESLIWPERYRGERSQGRVVELYKDAKASAEELMAFLDTKMRIQLAVLDGDVVDVRDQDDPNTSGKTRIYDIRNRYLIHQVRSLHAALERLDEERSSLFKKALLKDICRFPPEVGRELKDVIGQELEHPSYYWPGRYRPDNLRWAVSWQSNDGPFFTIDDCDDYHTDPSKPSPQPPSQPPSSVSPLPADPHVQEHDSARDSPSPFPQKDMDVDSGQTLPEEAKLGGKATPNSDMDMDVDESAVLAGETKREVGETPSAKGDMDIDRSEGLVGKAKGEEIPSVDVVTTELAGDSRMIGPGEDNQAITETVGSAETGELVEEPRDDKSSAVTSDSAGAVEDNPNPDFEIGSVNKLKRILRSPEGQRKRRKVEYPLQMSKGCPADLDVDMAD